MIKKRQQWLDFSTLGVTLFLSLVIIARTADQSPGPAVHVWALEVMGVLARPVQHLQNHMHIRDENQRLKQRNIELQLENSAMIAEREENRRLTCLLNLQQNTTYQTIPARVIGSEGMAGVQSLILNKGSRDSVFVNDAVVGGNGLAGKIARVAPDFSVMQAVSDKNFSAAARTRDSRVVGIFRGAGAYQSRLWGVPLHNKVQPGEVVITSGLHSLFPESLVLGTVSEITVDSGGLFYTILVVPAEQYDRIEHVLILKNTTL